MEAIAAMIGSETAAAAATSEEEAEREIQIVEIFNQDVAISGVALAARPGPPCRREHNKFISPSLRGRCHF